jgi:hypothetical protein
MNRTETLATGWWMRGRAVVVLLLFVVLSQGCQFIQNEFWNY